MTLPPLLFVRISKILTKRGFITEKLLFFRSSPSSLDKSAISIHLQIPSKMSRLLPRPRLTSIADCDFALGLDWKSSDEVLADISFLPVLLTM
jgi:hypothetical protein